MYYKGNGQPKTITTDHSIINAKINAVGNMAVATMETGYKGKIEVYNHKAEVVYKWQLGNSYVVDMDLSSDCKRLFVALLSTAGENIGTRVSAWKRDTTETIPAGTSIEREVDWKGLCGTINGGEHRVILIVNEQPIACEFSK